MKQFFALFYGLMLVFMIGCSSSTSQHRTDESFRSVYHHTPQANWMNDPNGMFYDETTRLWHLYYQYYPEGTVWGPMHWGHSVSKDLIHWDNLPTALFPDSIGMIFSGSCVIDRHNTAGFGENAVVAIYTSADKTQSQSIAYSTDGGVSFVKYEGNPVLEGDIPDFRDPKVFWDEQSGQWTMVLACQQEVRFYGSADLKHWHLESRFGAEYGAHGGVWECPDLIRLSYSEGDASGCGNSANQSWVLIVNINPGGPFGGSATQYFIGNWDGKSFTCFDSADEIKWLDYGKDHYATVTWHNAPCNRCVAIGWMSNWQYATVLPTVLFRSQNTIARELSLYVDDAGETRVGVRPFVFANEQDNSESELFPLKGEEIKGLSDACIVELELDGKENAVVTLSNSKGEKVVMSLDVHRLSFSMDRTASGDCSFSQDFAAHTTTPLFVKQDTYHILLFIDHCSVEAFDANGYWAMTNLVFPSEPYNRLDVQGGKASVYNVKI